jgi:hypothetical protein
LEAGVGDSQTREKGKSGVRNGFESSQVLNGPEGSGGNDDTRNDHVGSNRNVKGLIEDQIQDLEMTEGSNGSNAFSKGITRFHFSSLAAISRIQTNLN